MSKKSIINEEYIILFMIFLYYNQSNIANNQLYCTNQLLLNNILCTNNNLTQCLVCNCGRRCGN